VKQFGGRAVYNTHRLKEEMIIISTSNKSACYL